jgi:hypothetical protein
MDISVKLFSRVAFSQLSITNLQEMARDERSSSPDSSSKLNVGPSKSGLSSSDLEMPTGGGQSGEHAGSNRLRMRIDSTSRGNYKLFLRSLPIQNL